MQIGLIAAAIAATSTAPAPAPAPETWFTVLRDLEENETLLREAAPAEAPNGWITPADFPANMAPTEHFWTSLRVEIGADGRIVRCTPEEAGPVAAIACAKLRARGKFVAALDRNGRPVADTLDIRFVYAPTIVPTVPPAPPSPSGVHWDLMNAQSSLEMVEEPAWGKFVASAPKRSDEVAVSIARYGGAKPVIGCQVVARSSDRALDTATCDALKTARYGETADSYASLTLLVRWQGDRATIERPQRTDGIDLVFDRFAAEQSVAVLPEGAKRGGARLLFAADGKSVKCKIWRTTGIDSADLAACRKLEAIGYTRAIDIYNRPRTAEQWIVIGRGS